MVVDSNLTKMNINIKKEEDILSTKTKLDFELSYITYNYISPLFE